MERIKRKIKSIKTAILSFIDKCKNVKSSYDFYSWLWERPQTKEAFSLCKESLLKLLKKIKPSRIKGDITFGTGDPASTGEILGGVACLYGFYPEAVRITPDFQDKILEGELYAKGKIRLIHVLVVAIKLYFNRNVRYVYKRIKKNNSQAGSRQ